jgi:hypothetical protein
LYQVFRSGGIHIYSIAPPFPYILIVLDLPGQITRAFKKALVHFVFRACTVPLSFFILYQSPVTITLLIVLSFCEISLGYPVVCEAELRATDDKSYFKTLFLFTLTGDLLN